MTRTTTPATSAPTSTTSAKRSRKEAPPKGPKAAGKRGHGRLPKLAADECTLKTIAGLARIQCTNKESAAVLGVSEDTFANFRKATEAARSTWELGRESGKASLRRMQWRGARYRQGRPVQAARRFEYGAQDAGWPTPGGSGSSELLGKLASRTA